MSKASAKGSAWEAQRKRVLDRDGWRCAYCGVGVEGWTATVDHIEPISLDADRKYRDDELVSCCRRCNAIKSDKTLRRLDYAAPRWLPNGLPS